MLPPKRPIILVCTGLGRVQRGFEMYISSLAEKLATESSISLEVWAAGDWKSEKVRSKKILGISRKSLLFSRMKNPFLGEQRSFFFGMILPLILTRPVAVYLGEYQLYCYLFKLRSLLNLRYRLVLYTGGQALPGLFNPSLDFVHHVTNRYLDQCRHIPPSLQFVVPHFFDTGFEYFETIIYDLKKKAGGKRIVLSVGMVDKTVKRMNLLVKALESVKDVFPVILGDTSTETSEIEDQLVKNFGKDGYWLGKVPHPQLGSFYRAADLFVLCSPKESFGLAYIEALYHGLPIICDDFPEARFVLKDMACIVPMHSEINLINAIETNLLASPDSQITEARKRFAESHYSWPAVAHSYVEMFKRIASNMEI